MFRTEFDKAHKKVNICPADIDLYDFLEQRDRYDNKSVPDFGFLPLDFFLEITQPSSSLFKRHPMSNKTTIAGTYLSECACIKGQHDRCKSGNLRTSIENQIVDHINTAFKGKSVSLLSFGSGHYLQDLILLARLVKDRKVASIHITLLEVEPSKFSQADIKGMLQQLAKLTYIPIKYSFITPGELRQAPEQFDVIYAIDAEEIAFTSPGVFLGDDRTTKDDFISALEKLKLSADSLCALSHGNFGIFITTPYSLRTNPFKESLPDLVNIETISLIYINQHIFNLLLNIEFIKSAKKEIIINEALLNPEENFIKNLLETNNISYKIMKHEDAISAISNTKGLCLSLEYTPSDEFIAKKKRAYEGMQMLFPFPEGMKNICSLHYNIDYKTAFIMSAVRFFSLIDQDQIEASAAENRSVSLQFHLSISPMPMQAYIANLNDRFKLICDDDLYKKLLTTPHQLSESLLFNKSLTLQTYIEKLLQSSDVSDLTKAEQIIHALEEKSLQQFKDAAAIHRHAVTLQSKTTGAKLVEKIVSSGTYAPLSTEPPISTISDAARAARLDA